MNGFFGWVTGIIGMLVPGFGQAPPPSWNGYVEVDYAYVSAATPGVLETLDLKAGDKVSAGQVLFTLNAAQQKAAYAAAEANVDAAQANLDNLQTGGRSEEIAVVRASVAQAHADRDLAQQSYDRAVKLFDQGLVPQAQLDQARAALVSAEAKVSQLEAQLKVSELPARDAQQIAAEASLAAAKANALQAEAALDDRTVVATEAGRVEQVFFQSGEMAGAGVPVLSLQREGGLKVKFYLGETERGQFSLGEQVRVTCDGCATGLTATVDRFASDPQFTPPIIYSRDERNRLVFLTEAVLDNQDGLMPGQPVSIALSP